MKKYLLITSLVVFVGVFIIAVYLFLKKDEIPTTKSNSTLKQDSTKDVREGSPTLQQGESRNKELQNRETEYPWSMYIPYYSRHFSVEFVGNDNAQIRFLLATIYVDIDNDYESFKAEARTWMERKGIPIDTVQILYKKIKVDDPAT